MTNDKPKFLSFSNPVAWGIGLTMLLACLVTFLGIQIGPDGKTRYKEFLGSAPNAIGDTLAGIFAPLAFIWIVVTVFLQSQELREQRKELELTRAELKLARKAQEEQLKVMQAQADIFRDEKLRRDQEVSRRYLDQLLISLRGIVVTHKFSQTAWKFYKNTAPNQVTVLPGWKLSNDLDFPLNDDGAILHLAERAAVAMVTFREHAANCDELIEPDDTLSLLEEALRLCRLIATALESADSIQLERLHQLRVQDLQDYLESMYKAIKEKGR